MVVEPKIPPPAVGAAEEVVDDPNIDGVAVDVDPNPVPNVEPVDKPVEVGWLPNKPPPVCWV